jgi:Family of unknown function (DUF6459)
MTATLGMSGSPATFIRIRPAPALDPPADDARPPEEPVCRGQLALFASIYGVPRDRSVPAPRRSATGSSPAEAGFPGRDGGPGPAMTAAPAIVSGLSTTAPPIGPSLSDSSLSDSSPSGPSPSGLVLSGPPQPGRSPSGPSRSAQAHVAASRFVAACVEVLNGFRPATHLRALTTPLDFTDVSSQLARRAGRIQMSGRAPGKPAALVAVRRLRVCELPAGVAEAAAVLHRGDASWAMALRFERRRDTWLCTLLQMV